LVQGAYFGTDPDGALRALRRFLRGKRLLPVTRPIAERFGHIRGSLRQRGLIVGDADLLIAATAIHHDRILVTRNVRHFSRIPNLSLYRPTT
jgi:predicted nucleic acid-binding protein